VEGGWAVCRVCIGGEEEERWVCGVVVSCVADSGGGGGLVCGFVREQVIDLESCPTTTTPTIND
jgi:hypothetical protein